MAAKRFWQSISLLRVNLVVWALVAVLATVYWGELRWAAEVLPDYLEGRIGAPDERKLYFRASKWIRDGENLERAREYLEEAIAIDPTCEGALWMGEYLLVTGRDAEALDQFTRYIEIDPTIDRAYLGAAEILSAQGRMEEAREILERGVAYFSGERERYRPVLDPDVEIKYNLKAIRVYEKYEQSAIRLEEEIARLESGSEPAPSPASR